MNCKKVLQFYHHNNFVSEIIHIWAVEIVNRSNIYANNCNGFSCLTIVNRNEYIIEAARSYLHEYLSTIVVYLKEC